eukprot:scaffold266551_cov38-Prasinocladus_malaysianus.AAC.1
MAAGREVVFTDRSRGSFNLSEQHVSGQESRRDTTDLNRSIPMFHNAVIMSLWAFVAFSAVGFASGAVTVTRVGE